jgi:hypothetical protein
MTTLLNDLEGIECEINIENPVFENYVILLPCISKPLLYHYGSQSGYQRFRYSYFIKKSDIEANIICKHIITKVEYLPDEIYRRDDGYAGRCWIISVNNNENENFEKYYIRNWIDIIEFYKEKGFGFVEEKKSYY